MSTDRATHVHALDLAEQIPDIARRMREIAHDSRNWIRAPRSIYGWSGPADPEQPELTAGRHYDCDGWVPVTLYQGGLVEGEEQVDAQGIRWIQVPDLSVYLVARYLLVEHQTRTTITYTVDVPQGRPLRHLSLQVTVPGQLTQGQITDHESELAGMHEGLVLQFMPAAALGMGIRVSVRVGDPWPVVDPEKPLAIRVQTWKTPVCFDYVLDHELVEAPGPGPKRRVQLFGPDGRPL